MKVNEYVLKGIREHSSAEVWHLHQVLLIEGEATKLLVHAGVPLDDAVELVQGIARGNFNRGYEKGISLGYVRGASGA